MRRAHVMDGIMASLLALAEVNKGTITQHR